MSIDPPLSGREIQSRKGEPCIPSKSNITMAAVLPVRAIPLFTNTPKTTHAGLPLSVSRGRAKLHHGEQTARLCVAFL